MKVSIIVPIYNGEKNLSLLINSMLNQTYENIEIVLIDDASTDNSYNICTQYVNKNKNVKVLKNETKSGAGISRNKGLENASGELIIFIDADDSIKANMVERLVCAIEKNSADIAICGYETYIEAKGRIYREIIEFQEQFLNGQDKVREYFTRSFPDGEVGYLWNKIYRMDIIKENNIKFPNMKRLQDGFFNILYFDKITSCEIINDRLYNYKKDTQEDMFRKCPNDYYDLVLKMVELFLEKTNSWGFNFKEKILVFLLNEVGTCIENAYSDNWEMSVEEREKYFLRITQDSFFKSAVMYKGYISFYRRVLIDFLIKGNYACLKIIVVMKVALKKNFKKIYYLLKK